MKKTEFIAGLGSRLGVLSGEDLKRTLDYYSEMIDDCVEDGMSEDEATAALGSVDEIAAEILGDSSALVVRSIEGANDAPRDAFDFSESFTKLSAKLGESEIIVKNSGNGACRIECVNANKLWHRVWLSGGTLNIERVDERGFFKRFGAISTRIQVTVYLPKARYEELSIETASGGITVDTDAEFYNARVKSASGSIRFNAQTRGRLSAASMSGSVKVYDAEPTEVHVSSMSGRVELESIVTSGALIAESTSGSVRVSDSTCAAAKLSSLSGAIDASDLSVGGDLEAISTSGSIKLDDVNCGGRLDAKSRSGSIKLDDTVSEGSLEAGSTSGSLRLEDCDGAEVLLKTVSGSIKGSLLTGKCFSARSVSGSVNIPMSAPGGKCEAKSTSGSISLKVKTK